MRRVSRYLLGIVTCAVPVFIAACYGIAMSFSQRGRVIDKDSKAGVGGLRVECLTASSAVSDMTTTALDGAFDLHTADQASCTTIAVDDQRAASSHYASTTAKSDASKDLVIEVALQP